MPHEINKSSPPPSELAQLNNVASRLGSPSSGQPNNVAIASPLGKYYPGAKRAYRQMTFAQLELHTNSIAAACNRWVSDGHVRIVLAVKFGIDFVALVFALLKVGAVVVLIDPGMGRKNLIACLEQTKPDGFVAIPLLKWCASVCAIDFDRRSSTLPTGARFGFLPSPTLVDLERTLPRCLIHLK